MVGVVVSRIFSALAWKFWPTGEVSKSSLRAFGPLDLPVEIFLAMLQRNLVYTALTRAKRLAVFVGSKKALGMAVGNARVRRRWSGLPERIRREAKLAPLLTEPSLAPRDAEADEAQFAEDAPPDSIYEDEATAGYEDLSDGSELTYHPVDE